MAWRIPGWLRSPDSRLPQAIILFGAATVCLLWIGIFHWSRVEEHETFVAVQRDTQNLVIAFDEDVLRTVTAIDQALVVIKAEYERDPDHFRLPDWINQSPALLGTTVQIGIIGADGRVRMSNDDPTDDPIDLSDRAHFRYHLSPAAPQPYISAPVRGRVSGKPSIQITRRLERADHSFDGVLVVSLDPSYLSRFFDTVDLGEQGIVLLVGRDSIVRARRTRAPGVGLDNLSKTRLFHEISTANRGTFRARSPIDGIDRILSFAAVPNYPLAVVVGLGVDEALGNAQKNLRRSMLQGTIVSLVIVGLVALLLRQIAQREETEAQLRQAQKMESIGRLTGGIAHDFNNMLTAIAGNLERVLRKEKDPESVRHLRNIERTVSHGERLVHHLLAFARKQHLKPEPVDVNRLVENFVEILKATCGAQVHIDAELTRDLWLAMADASQLETAILNVALNARDAMPKGGNIVIETANVGADGRRPRDLHPGDEFVSITIRDTGTGMTEEVRAKAFDPFFTTKEFGRGSGLGLSQVYGIAKQSGGTVELDSAPDQGTTVRIYLPRASAHEVDPSPAKVDPPRSVTILVVDDDPLVRAFVTESLTEAGYSVLEAADGRAALRTLGQEPVDLAVIDLRMPDMTGSEVARWARLSREHLPILFITSYADSELSRAVSDEALLVKPFRASALKAEVANIVERARARSDRKIELGQADPSGE